MLLVLWFLLTTYMLNVDTYLNISTKYQLDKIAYEEIQSVLDNKMLSGNLPQDLVQDLVPREDIEFGFFERIENVIGYIKGDTLGIATYNPETYAWKFKVNFESYLNQLPEREITEKIEKQISEVNEIIYDVTRANIHQIDFNFLQYTKTFIPIIFGIRLLLNPMVILGIIVGQIGGVYLINRLLDYKKIQLFYWAGIPFLASAITLYTVRTYLINKNISVELMKFEELNQALNSFLEGFLTQIQVISVSLFLIGILLIFPNIIFFIKKTLK